MYFFIIFNLKQIGKVEFNIPALTKDVQLSINDSAMIIVVTGVLFILYFLSIIFKIINI
jgi:hypothetical protein